MSFGYRVLGFGVGASKRADYTAEYLIIAGGGYGGYSLSGCGGGGGPVPRRLGVGNLLGR